MTELEKAASGLLYDANSDPRTARSACADQRSVHGLQRTPFLPEGGEKRPSAYHFRVPVRPISSLSRRFLSITAAIRVSAVHFMQTITL